MNKTRKMQALQGLEFLVLASLGCFVLMFVIVYACIVFLE